MKQKATPWVLHKNSGRFVYEEAVNREHEARMNVMHERFKGRLS
jgi:hypothetical protein